MRTKAAPNGGGTYTLQGTRGIPLFIAPRYWVNDDGSTGEFNNIRCGSIEKKMGLKASATGVMNYDGARERLQMRALSGPMNPGVLPTPLSCNPLCAAC